MPIDFSATPDDSPTNNTADGPMFAPVPAWERNKKRRGFGGGRRASEPRSFAPTADPLIAEPAADSMGPLEADDGNFAAGPTFANRTRKTASSKAPLAIVAGLIVIGGVGAAGWYAMQPHAGQGVAELTPGSSSSSTATTPDGSVTTQVAQATTPDTPAAPAEKATTTTTTARTAHGTITHKTTTTVRSRAASDTAADASTTAPMPAAVQATPAPQAAPAAAPPAAAATPAPAAPLHLNLPPSSTAPTTTAPADTPAPVQSAPATTAPPPTQTPPTA
jgi:cytoskeletal protein RodZ